MEFSRQEYWSGLPFHSPGDLSDSGIDLFLIEGQQLCNIMLVYAIHQHELAMLTISCWFLPYINMN